MLLKILLEIVIVFYTKLTFLLFSKLGQSLKFIMNRNNLTLFDRNHYSLHRTSLLFPIVLHSTPPFPVLLSSLVVNMNLNSDEADIGPLGELRESILSW